MLFSLNPVKSLKHLTAAFLFYIKKHYIDLPQGTNREKIYNVVQKINHERHIVNYEQIPISYNLFGSGISLVYKVSFPRNIGMKERKILA